LRAALFRKAEKRICDLPAFPYRLEEGKLRGPIIMMTETRSRPAYDFPTAVTFLFAGLGLGWILAFLFSPLAEPSPLRRPLPRSRSVADEAFSR
jgi:hypothetical protein